MSDQRDSVRWYTYNNATTWLWTFGGALLITVIVAARNYTLSRLVGRPTPFHLVFLAELPVWLAWAVLLPGIVWFSRKYPPVGRRAWRNMMLHIAAGCVTTLIVIVALVVARSFLPGSPVPGSLWAAVGTAYLATILAFIFIYFSAVGLILAGSFYAEQQQRRARESELEAMLARSERDVLRMQIHPHFLFNTMHAISAMMMDDVPGARRMMSRLSELLRLTIEEDAPHLVPLEQELQLLRAYLEIQSIRFGERLCIEEHIDVDTRAMLVPRLIMQPIVENAIIHGIARIEGQGRILLSSRCEEAMLVVDVQDNGAGLSITGPGIRERVGLTNSRARLRQFFGDSASIMVLPNEHGTTAQMRLPVRLT